MINTMDTISMNLIRSHVFRAVSMERIDPRIVQRFVSQHSDIRIGDSISPEYIIEELGLSDMSIGTVSLSRDHPNCIMGTEPVNPEHIAMLISYIKQQVRDGLGIQLEENTP
jgi:UDP-N-acetylenolpyruvoylglucosamine reductase